MPIIIFCLLLFKKPARNKTTTIGQRYAPAEVVVAVVVVINGGESNVLIAFTYVSLFLETFEDPPMLSSLDLE